MPDQGSAFPKCYGILGGPRGRANSHWWIPNHRINRRQHANFHDFGLRDMREAPHFTLTGLELLHFGNVPEDFCPDQVFLAPDNLPAALSLALSWAGAGFFRSI